MPREPGSTYPGCHNGKPYGSVDGKGYNPAPPKCQSIQVKRCKGVAERYGPLLLMGCSGAVRHRMQLGCSAACGTDATRVALACTRVTCASGHTAQLSIPGVLVLCARTWSEWLRSLGQIPLGQTPGEYCTLHGLPPHFSFIHL